MLSDQLLREDGSRVTVIHLDKKYKDIGDMDDESIRKLEFQFDNSISSMLK